MLAHHETLRGLRRKAREAFLELHEELRLLERRLRLLPGARQLEPVPFLVEQGVEFLLRSCRRLARRAPDAVDDLVLEDAGEPGAQVRAAAEAGFAGQGGEQGLLHGVLGGMGVPQLQARVAQQIRALAFDTGPKVMHRGGIRFYKGLETCP